MEYEIHNSSDELTHWGIRGMRWGIRRYQNKDGSLTPAGKKRLKAESDAIKKEEQVLKNRKAVNAKLDRLEAKKKAIADEKKALDEANRPGKKGKKGAGDDAEPDKKSVKDMSNKELAAAIERARLEDTYAQLRPEPKVEKHPFMKKVVNDVVVPAAVNAGKNFMQNAMNKLTDRIFQEKLDPNSIEALRKVRDKLQLETEIDDYKKGAKSNWENLLKQQQYKTNEEDRASKMKGYKDAPDEAKAKRDEDAAKAKRDADEAARKSNEARSQEQYNATYASKGGERTKVNPAESANIKVPTTPVSSVPKTTTSRGQSTVNTHMNDNVYDLLDSSGQVIATYKDDD